MNYFAEKDLVLDQLPLDGTSKAVRSNSSDLKKANKALLTESLYLKVGRTQERRA